MTWPAEADSGAPMLTIAAAGAARGRILTTKRDSPRCRPGWEAALLVADTAEPNSNAARPAHRAVASSEIADGIPPGLEARGPAGNRRQATNRCLDPGWVAARRLATQAA
jgi:hypothetical protein